MLFDSLVRMVKNKNQLIYINSVLFRFDVVYDKIYICILSEHSVNLNFQFVFCIFGFDRFDTMSDNIFEHKHTLTQIKMHWITWTFIYF